MRDVFAFIRRTPSREFLLRASYLEIYNEQIHDLLSPAATGSLVLQDSGVVVNLREEVVMSVKGLREVLERGEANRRTASTDWNSRSSRSHSVFRLVSILLQGEHWKVADPIRSRPLNHEKFPPDRMNLVPQMGEYLVHPEEVDFRLAEDDQLHHPPL